MNMKTLILALAVTLTMALPLKAISDSTSVSPPAPSSMTSGTVPTPPVCNASNQMLRWTGSAWQCIANPGVSTIGKGGYMGSASSPTSCPSGSNAVYIGEVGSRTGFTTLSKVYICFKK